MTKDEVLKLSELARVGISGEEAENLTHEFESILGYVGEVKEVNKLKSLEVGKQEHAVRNVMREDSNPHESGKHTEDLLGEAPSREGDYIKVKQILG